MIDPTSFTWLSVIGLSLTLFISVLSWFFKHNDRRQKEKDNARKEISEAIASGDVSRIHAVIDQLRRQAPESTGTGHRS